MSPQDGLVIRVSQYNAAVLECSAVGIPRPTIRWLVSRNGQNSTLSTNGSVTILEPVQFDNYPLSSGRGLVLAVNSTLVINETLDADSGTYYCEAMNDPGRDRQGIELEIQGECDFSYEDTVSR